MATRRIYFRDRVRARLAYRDREETRASQNLQGPESRPDRQFCHINTKTFVFRKISCSMTEAPSPSRQSLSTHSAFIQPHALKESIPPTMLVNYAGRRVANLTRGCFPSRATRFLTRCPLIAQGTKLSICLTRELSKLPALHTCDISGWLRAHKLVGKLIC